MSHNLFGERFLSYRRPAWHGLGLVLDEEIGAYDAFTKIGTYEVHLEDLVTETGLRLPNRAVVRAPTDDDPMPRPFGIVSDTYTLITPTNVCDVWDRAVARPIETIGSLDKGATFFVTTKLPTLDIAGDEVENYLLLISPMTGGDALQIRVSPVRVVCQNTLVVAKKASSETYRIVHDEQAEIRLSSWLTGIYDRAIEKAATINADFAAMAAKRLDGGAVNRILEMTYTMPKLPRSDAPEVVMVERRAAYEYQKEWAENRRTGARALFEGKGVGTETPAARGTAWGLYNAVVELEDYSTPRRSDASARSEEALTGSRARAKERAYEACLKEAK